MNQINNKQNLHAFCAIIILGIVSFIVAYIISYSSQIQSQTATAVTQRTVNYPPIKPLTIFSQSITSSVKSLNLVVNQEIRLPVSIKNTGNQVWHGLRPRTIPTQDNQAQIVALAFHWINLANKVTTPGSTTFIYGDVYPGQRINLNAIATAPLVPGNYQLQMSLVQEGVAWFDRSGSKPFIIPVTVSK